MKWNRNYKKKSKYWEWFNNHHLINKVRGWSNAEENKRRTKVRLHNCLHQLFGNETPAEAVSSLIDYFWTVFTEWFRSDIYGVLTAHKWVEHNQKCYRNNKIKGGWVSDLLANWTK